MGIANEIFGAFHFREDVVSKVSTLELKGLKAENITILTNKKNADALKNRTDVNVENNSSESVKNDSFIDKVKKAVKNEQSSSPDIHDKLVGLGVSRNQAAKYLEAIEVGKTIVVADDQLRMGNDSTSDTVKLKEEVIHRNG